MRINQKSFPPKLAIKFLHWFLKDDLAEEVEGDLEEQFYAKLEEGSDFKAKINYWFQVFAYFRPFAIRNLSNTSTNHYAMYRNYFKVGFRNILRNKKHSIINIGGLAIGMSVAAFIGLFLIQELSYESIHRKADRIYRITMHIHRDTYNMHWARLNTDWINDLPNEIPEVQNLIRFQNFRPRNIKVEDLAFKINHAYSTDKEVFEVFDFDLLRGNPETALAHANTVVLTESMASLFFGNQDPMGKVITILSQNETEKQRYEVTGIIADLPPNTHLPVNMLTSFSSEDDRTGWAYTYILLKNSINDEIVANKISNFIEKSIGEEEANNISLPIQNIQSIHLHSDLARELKPNGKISHLFLFGSVGIFILIMTTINFINLNTVQSLKRLREIALRKVLGSSKNKLAAYFLVEANFITLLAALLGLALIILIMPTFQELAPISVSILKIVPILLLVAVLIGFTAGYYPAFVLSNKKVLVAIKSKEGQLGLNGSGRIKNVLVACQLILCIMMIGGALITQSQFQYLVNKDLGLDKSQVLAITDIPQVAKFKYDFFKNELDQLKGVNQVAASMGAPSEEIRDAGPIFAEGIMEDETQSPVMDIQIIDNNFIGLMDIDLLAGKVFNKKDASAISPEIMEDLLGYLQSQPREYIINETALRMIGWESPEEAIGKTFGWNIGNISLQKGPIVGVVKDFHQENLKNKIEPMVFILEPIWIENVLVKVEGNDIFSTVAEIEKIWKKTFPDFTMEHAFLDELYDQLYKTEKKQLQLIYLFSGMAIFIAFLGIFGLFSQILKFKEKEIAIRKILGADLLSITMLLSRKFLLFVIIGVIVAIPLAWLGMEKWLQHFTYRIPIEPVHFLIAVVFIILVLFLSISFQIQKAAVSNPANTLRSE